MDHKGLVIAGRDGDPCDLPKFNGCLLFQLVVSIQSIEVEVAQDVDARIRLHATVQLGDVGRVEELCVFIKILEGPHL